MDIEALQRELGAKSQSDLARMLGVPVSYLSDLKASRRKISVRFARAVETATGRTGLVDQVIEARAA